jgi:hypothetical protein
MTSRRKSNTSLIVIISAFLCVVICACILIISALINGDILSLPTSATPKVMDTPLSIDAIIELTYSASIAQTALVSSPTPLPTLTPASQIENAPTATVFIFQLQTDVAQPTEYIYSTNTPFIFTQPTSVQPTLITVPLPTSGDSGGGCCKHCSVGKPCGDSCISKNYTCHKPPGCACY